MTHAAFHFAIGCSTGTILMMIRFPRKLRSGKKAAGELGRELLLSFGLGIFAMVPGILSLLHLPEVICRGWWMNVFFLYPLLNSITHGGVLVGEMLILLNFMVQHALLLFLLIKKRHLDPYVREQA